MHLEDTEHHTRRKTWPGQVPATHIQLIMPMWSSVVAFSNTFMSTESWADEVVIRDPHRVDA